MPRPFPHECDHRWLVVYGDGTLVCRFCMSIHRVDDPPVEPSNTYVVPAVRDPWYVDLIHQMQESL